MIANRKVIVVLPAYNAERTLERTYGRIPRDVVDEIILIDDGSQDRTVETATRLGIATWRHVTNRGYGATQKTSYQLAISRGADVIVMLHPDDQYPPELIPVLAEQVAYGHAHVVIGSRLLMDGAIRRGMPWYKYLFNRLWTFGQNLCLGQRLSEYHTGFRAFSREFLLRVPLLENSDDFLFDNQILVQAVSFGYAVDEVPVPAQFPPDASSISVWRGIWYGLGIVVTTCQFLLQQAGLVRFRLFDPGGRRLTDSASCNEPAATAGSPVGIGPGVGTLGAAQYSRAA